MDPTPQKATLTPVQAIKRFFEDGPSGRKVELIEMKNLSKEERAELGALCLIALKKIGKATL